jgi:hypothetical protein
MTTNPNTIPEHLRELTQGDRDKISLALDTVFTHIRDAAGERLYELLDDEGWYAECEDCQTTLAIDELGNECLDCGHVNGDPTTGSTPDDQPMRVCDACWGGNHQHCDHEVMILPDHLGDESPGVYYCNCGRLDHPPVTTDNPSV